MVQLVTLGHATDIATITVAVVAALAAVGGSIAWFYRRGGQERAYTDALERNTKANNDVAVKLDEFKGVVLDMFHSLDKRVSRVEDRLEIK